MAGRERFIRIPAEGDVPLGTRLRAFRHSRGISREEFAKQLGGYHPTYVSRLELDQAPFTFEVQENLKEFFGISVEDLKDIPNTQLIEWMRTHLKARRQAKISELEQIRETETKPRSAVDVVQESIQTIKRLEELQRELLKLVK